MVLEMRKMKDSGIEWIGEIPEGWKITRLKYLADFEPTCDTSYLTNESKITYDGHPAKVHEPAGRQDPDLSPVSPVGRGAQAGGRCAAKGCRAALSHPAQRRVGQVQLHCLDGVPAGFPVQHREQAGVCQRHRGD